MSRFRELRRRNWWSGASPWSGWHMAHVFINFRADDSAGFAALLQRELRRQLGPTSVFFAATSIRPGDDFRTRLLDGVREAAVVIAVIGPRWLTAPHPVHGRAIDHERDWVRRELAEAFARGVRVIPVLIDDTERLTDAVLPRDIHALTHCQYLRLRHDDLEHDLARITATLRAALSPAGAGCPGAADEVAY